MNNSKPVVSTAREAIVLISIFALVLAPIRYGVITSAQAQEVDDFAPGEDFSSGRDKDQDPCDHPSQSQGKAKGKDKRCRDTTSSSGIARGDFNGDGFGDLAVGVPDEDTGGQEDAGAVVVIYGSADGLAASGTSMVRSSQFWSQGSSGIPGVPEEDDHFGKSLAAGKFNDDIYSDLAIGVPGEDIPNFEDSGAVNIIYGSPSGLTATDPTVPAPQAWDLLLFDTGVLEAQIAFGDDEEFGASLAWGDFNGDGIGDLAIGVPGKIREKNRTSFCIFDCVIKIHAAGGVVILYGTPNDGLTRSGRQFWDQDGSLILTSSSARQQDIQDEAEETDYFGSALAAGDFDGDGDSDLAIGVPGEGVEALSEQGDDYGAVHVLFGSSSGLTNANNDLRGGRDPDDDFGSALAAGNFNGDSRRISIGPFLVAIPVDDLAIGVPGDGELEVGAVRVFYGSSSGFGLSQEFTQNDLFPGDSEPEDRFGSVLAAGDFDGNGKKDLAVGVPREDITVFRNATPVNLTDAGEVKIIYSSNTPGVGLATANAQRWNQDMMGFNVFAMTGSGLSDKPDKFGSSLSAWNYGKGTQAELVIGVPNANVGSNLDAGAVNVLYGPITPIRALGIGHQYWHQNSAGIPGSAEAYDHFGAAAY